MNNSSVSVNSLNCSLITVPTASNYYANIPTLSLVFIIIGCVIAVVLLVVYIVEIRFVFKYISSDSPRAGQITWLLGIYAITPMLSVVGASVPRAMPITNMFILLYFARLLFVYIQLVVDLFGGRIAMASDVHGTALKTNTGPLCCCCLCLPKIRPTIINIRRIEFLVYQAAIIRPVIFFANGTVWADLQGDVKTNNAFFQIVSIVNLSSTLLAMYGYNLFANIAADPLKDFCIKKQMKLMQILMLLFNLQGNVLELLAGSNGPIYCDYILPATSRASLFNFALLPLESLFLSLGTAWFLRPEVNAIFDLHPKWKRKPSSKEVNEHMMKRERESQVRLSNGQVITKQDIRYLYVPRSKSTPSTPDMPHDVKFAFGEFQDDGRETDV